MKYMVTFSLPSATFHARVKRFLETGGLPPLGVTMHGRWHSLGGDKGFVLASSDDPKGIYEWIGQWADLMDFNAVPVLDDADAAAVLKTIKP